VCPFCALVRSILVGLRDFSLGTWCTEVVFVGGYQCALGSYKRHTVIVRSKKMLFEFHRKL